MDRGQATEASSGEARYLGPLLTLFWIGSIAATMAQVYLLQSLSDVRPSLFDLMRWVLPGYLVWIVGAPLVVVFLSRRFAFGPRGWFRSTAVHLVASLVIAAATLAVDALFAVLERPDRTFLDAYSDIARGWLLWILFTYWFFLAVLFAVRHAITARARELRATQLEAAVATAQLAALKTQIHPHFLFNALNSVSSLIADEPTAAQKMIARLGDLLRSTLADGTGGDWTVRRELEVLAQYTAIEEVRFGDRLEVVIECTTESRSALVPSLLLLPLAENAILHGIEPAMTGGTVHVSARRDGSHLCIEVSDDGVGWQSRDGRPPIERIGLGNTRQRLQMRFGDEHRFDVEARTPMGTCVRIVIPWATTATDAEAHVPAA